MKLFKNRTVLGIFCIAVSLIICFAITPLVNAGLSKKVTIVRFNRQVNEGEEITRSMLDEVEVGNHNLPRHLPHIHPLVFLVPCYLFLLVITFPYKILRKSH